MVIKFQKGTDTVKFDNFTHGALPGEVGDRIQIKKF